MRIKVEIEDQPRVYVHNMQPTIMALNGSRTQPLYVLRNQDDRPCAISVFMETKELQSLYGQLKEILEPEAPEEQEESSTCAQPASV